MTFGVPVDVFQTFLTEFWNDTKPPVVRDVFVEDIQPTTASVFVTTREDSRTQIFISTDPDIVDDADKFTDGTSDYDTGRWRSAGGTLELDAQIDLTGLNDNKDYYFRVLVEDEAGNIYLYNEDFTFHTSNDPPPTIKNVDVATRIDGADFTWNTNEPCEARVTWGQTEGSYPNETSYTSIGTNHGRSINDLDHGEDYFYRIEARDVGNNTGRRSGSFTTDEDPDPDISNVDHRDLQRNSVRIIWDTNEDTSGRVRYGRNPGDYTETQEEEDPGGEAHEAIITGLNTDTTYFYRIFVEDSADQAEQSGEGSFTTLDNPDQVGYSSANNGGGSSFLTIEVPPGAKQNDILIAAIAVFEGEDVSSTPEGWNHERHRAQDSAQIALYWRKYNSGDPDYIFDLSGSPMANGGIGAYRNVDRDNPIFDSNSNGATTNELTVDCDGPGVPTIFFAAACVNADEGMGVITGGFVERFEPRSERNMLGADRDSDDSNEAITFDIGTAIDRSMAAVMCSLRPL